MKTLISLILGFSILLTSNNLLAHTKILTSIPADNASYDTPLAAVELNFNKPSRLIKLSLKSQNKKIPLSFKPSAKANTYFSIPLPKLKQGQYSLEWITLGSDGHKMKSKISFKQK